MSADLFVTRYRPIYGKGQVKAYTGTAGTIDSALPPCTPAVAVICTTFAYVKIGSNPTATTADMPVPANVLVVLPVEGAFTASDIKVSAVQVAAGGNLHVIPLAE